MPIITPNSVQELETAYTINSDEVDLRYSSGFCVVSEVTVSTPAAKAFTVDASTDVCTASAHGMLTGLKVQVSTTTTLPAGLAAATDYFIIRVSADTFKFAASLANAQAGTAIDITDAGAGTHTVTPTALAGASVKLQASVDGSTYIDLSGTSQSITASGDFMWNVADAMYPMFRAVYTLTAGQLSVTQSTSVHSG